jgi:hypothetical protein
VEAASEAAAVQLYAEVAAEKRRLAEMRAQAEEDDRRVDLELKKQVSQESKPIVHLFLSLSLSLSVYPHFLSVPTFFSALEFEL